MPPVEEFIKTVEVFIAGLEKPSLKLFLSSLLDQEKEHLKDIGEVFLSSDFPDNEDPEFNRICKELLESMVQNLPEISDSLSLMGDTIRRKQAAYNFFSYLASHTGGSSVSDSLMSITLEEKRHIKLLEDRLTLEELSAG